MSLTPDDQQFLCDVAWQLTSDRCVGSTRPATGVNVVIEDGAPVYYGRCSGCGRLVQVSYGQHIPLPHPPIEG